MRIAVVPLRQPARALAVIAVLVCAACCGARAQVTGVHHFQQRDRQSVRPILVGVEFEGNSALSTNLIKANIVTQSTGQSFAGRFFAVFTSTPFTAPLESIAAIVSDSVRPVIHNRLSSVVDSLTGNVRYLNLTSAAADTATIKALYNRFGFHEATVAFQARVDTVRNSAIVRYTIDEGPRYTLSGINYIGIDTIPEQLQAQVRKAKIVSRNSDYSAADLDKEIAQSVGLLRNNGYAFARRGDVVVLMDDTTRPDRPHDSVLVTLVPGMRYRFGQTRYLDDPSVDMCLGSDEISNQIVYEKGAWYSQQKVEQSVGNLYNTLGLFELARIDSSAALTHGDTLGMQVHVRYRQRLNLQATPQFSVERRVNQYRWFAGSNVDFGLLDPFCEGGRFSAQGRYLGRLSQFVGDNQYGVSASYYIPDLLFPFLSFRFSSSVDFAVENRLESATYLEPTDNGDTTIVLPERIFRSERYQLQTEVIPRLPSYTFVNGITGHVTGQWLQYINIASYLHGLAERRVATAQAEGLLDTQTDSTSLIDQVVVLLARDIYRNQVLQGDSRALVDSLDDQPAADAYSSLNLTVQLGAEFTGDHRDNIFEPTNGYFVKSLVEFGMVGLANGLYAKADIDGRWYFPFATGVLATRAHIGAIDPRLFGGVSLVPLPSLFWAGGANSIRGWGPREMLATRTEQSLEGVNSQVFRDILRESRTLLGGLGVLELSAEYRVHPFGVPQANDPMATVSSNIVTMVFLDAGNAFARNVDELTDLKFIGQNIAVSIGAGIGYSLPIGPIWAGFGLPIYDPINYDAGERLLWQHQFQFSNLTFQLSLGYAF